MKKLDLLKAQMLQTCTTIFGEDSMTALELAGETACKVNECVKMVNMLVDDVEQIIIELISELITGGQFYIDGDKLVIIGGEVADE